MAGRSMSSGPTTAIELWWLQSRPITGIEGLRVYSNRIAREVLPGVIKPLVWTVNVPVVNAAWIELLEELVGPLDVEPDDLARSFGHRAYFDMTTLGDIFEAIGMPRDSLELLLGLPKGPEAPGFKPGPGVARHLYRMPRFVRSSLHRGRWARAEVHALRRAYEAIADVVPGDLDDSGTVGARRRVDDADPARRVRQHRGAAADARVRPRVGAPGGRRRPRPGHGRPCHRAG